MYIVLVQCEGVKPITFCFSQTQLPFKIFFNSTRDQITPETLLARHFYRTRFLLMQFTSTQLPAQPADKDRVYPVFLYSTAIAAAADLSCMSCCWTCYCLLLAATNPCGRPLPPPVSGAR